MTETGEGVEVAAEAPMASSGWRICSKLEDQLYITQRPLRTATSEDQYPGVIGPSQLHPVEHHECELHEDGVEVSGLEPPTSTLRT